MLLALHEGGEVLLESFFAFLAGHLVMLSFRLVAWPDPPPISTRAAVGVNSFCYTAGEQPPRARRVPRVTRCTVYRTVRASERTCCWRRHDNDTLFPNETRNRDHLLVGSAHPSGDVDPLR